MSDRQTLLVALVVVYLLECIFWVRHGAMVVRTWWGRHWGLGFPGELGGNQRGGLCVSNPLPGQGTVYVTRLAPLSLSRDGVLAWASHMIPGQPRSVSTGQFLAWNEIRTIEAREKELVINDQVVWQCDSVHGPLRWAPVLESLKLVNPEKRADRIREFLAATLDRAAIAARCQELRRRSGWLEGLTFSLFILLFGVGPWTVWRFGWLPALWYLLAALAAHTGAITVLFVRIHRHFFPRAGDERFRLKFILAMAPAASIRAMDYLTRPLLEEFHPIAVAAEFLTAPKFHALARSYWRDLEFPRLPDVPSVAGAPVEVARWFREAEKSELEKFLSAAGVGRGVLRDSPKSTDPAHSHFCPRCEAQFTKVAKECSACGGRKLLSLDSSSDAAASDTAGRT